MSDEEKTVEIVEPEVTTEPKVPTRDELKSQGWSAKELESAEKRGMIANPEEKKTEDPKPEPKVEEPAKSEPKKDFSHSQQFRDAELTEEQEKELRRLFPFTDGKMNPAEAIYWRMKNERTARQQAIADLERERKARQEIEAKLATVQPTKQEVDENGDIVDPEEKPLTLKQLKEIQKQEAEAIEKQRREQTDRASRVTEAQETQENYVRSLHKDFDDTVGKAKEVMQKLDDLVPEPWKQNKIVRLVRDLQVAAANADQMNLDDYNAAFIAYEIGQFHPDYGKTNGSAPTETGNSKDPKANGGLTPEQMKRIEENTQRRLSSASVTGGGGRRAVAVDDVKLADLNKMGYAARQKFRQEHPARYAELLRG